MSDRASTSSCSFSGSALTLLLLFFSLSLSPFLLGGSGDAKVLRGVEPSPSFGLLCDGEVGFDIGAVEAR